MFSVAQDGCLTLFPLKVFVQFRAVTHIFAPLVSSTFGANFSLIPAEFYL